MSQRDKPRLALNNITAGVREPSEWSGGPSDIEGKTTRVGASEYGQRTSFNRTREAGCLDEIQGVVANTLNGASGKRCDIDGKAARPGVNKSSYIAMGPSAPSTG
jgi:hypothetical protein